MLRDTIATLIFVMLAACATTEPERATLVSAESAAAEPAEDVKAMSDPDYDPDEIICKTDTRTGSRLGGQRDCRTAEQWRRSMSNAFRSINDWRSNNQGGVTQ